MMEEKSSIISYNSRGFNKCKQDFLRNILSEVGGHTFLFNQENFLLKKNGYIAEQALPEHRIVFKPAVKDSLEGRPKGGMFIAVEKDFHHLIIGGDINADF